MIPISNSLGEETALVNVSISIADMKCQRVMLSDMPTDPGCLDQGFKLACGGGVDLCSLTNFS